MIEVHCPHCDSPLSPRAVACRECGSDIETGWSDDVDYHSVALPEDDPSPRARGPWIKTIAILCVFALLGGAVTLLGGDILLVFVAIFIGAPIAFGLSKSGDG
jgi:hypothetical protein